MAFPAASVIPVPEALKSKPNVPLLLIFIVTSVVVPDDDTDAMVPDAVPVRAKSFSSTPFTASLKVTRYITLVEFVISPAGECLLIDTTDGNVVSTIYA